MKYTAEHGLAILKFLKLPLRPGEERRFSAKWDQAYEKCLGDPIVTTAYVYSDLPYSENPDPLLEPEFRPTFEQRALSHYFESQTRARIFARRRMKYL